MPIPRTDRISHIGQDEIHQSRRSFFAEAGDGWNIPGNVEHGVEVLENAVVIEVFSQARRPLTRCSVYIIMYMI